MPVHGFNIKFFIEKRFPILVALPDLNPRCYRVGECILMILDMQRHTDGTSLFAFCISVTYKGYSLNFRTSRLRSENATSNGEIAKGPHVNRATESHREDSNYNPNAETKLGNFSGFLCFPSRIQEVLSPAVWDSTLTGDSDQWHHWPAKFSLLVNLGLDLIVPLAVLRERQEPFDLPETQKHDVRTDVAGSAGSSELDVTRVLTEMAPAGGNLTASADCFLQGGTPVSTGVGAPARRGRDPRLEAALALYCPWVYMQYPYLPRHWVLADLSLLSKGLLDYLYVLLMPVGNVRESKNTCSHHVVNLSPQHR
ncbi:hypothetical protein SODALDRAFT_355683 [Sodiomyces alkalinus F11]|uniref:Uncharacterized protein n=1 Tax=Sodiomyces alkalinus (strain CBS 110278 / VKM F-3762 / F11) TaxID=1314773 RepID=A0A3N2Q9N1_SODAK|nr:hypothetical protein SODALDRAFT_355683 [Sodiomyces alkalinus F11]ROT43474.1 hypothetical protein SODALDRAFT_355683 [Sodiomyces alkalinus F11]